MYPWQNFILGLCEHLAWPILVAVCIYVFRKDIRSMLSRMTKLPGGAELNPETVEKQEEAKKEFNIIFKDWTQQKAGEKNKQDKPKEKKEDK